MENSIKQEGKYDIIDLLAWLRDNNRKDLTQMMNIKNEISRVTISNPPKHLNGILTIDIPADWANKFMSDKGEIELACMVVVFRGATEEFISDMKERKTCLI